MTRRASDIWEIEAKVRDVEKAAKWVGEIQGPGRLDGRMLRIVRRGQERPE